MITKTDPCLLQQLENSGINVDVDSMNPHLAESLPFTAHDMTSNQIVVHQQLVNPENKDLVERTIREMKGSSWEEIHTVLSTRFAKRVYPHISGRVLVQVTTRRAYDVDAIVKHATAYAKAFNAEGIANDRFCIKIPTTTAGVQAAVILKQAGIATLGTAMFSLPQAIAAGQAGMHAISPYFNQTRAHEEEDLYPDVEDVAMQHPMAFRMIHIRDTYREMERETGVKAPQIKGASNITAHECMAMPELGADHITILADQMDDLLCTSRLPVWAPKTSWQRRVRAKLSDPSVQWVEWTPPRPAESVKRMSEMRKADPLAKGEGEGGFKMADWREDWLKDGKLDGANEGDEATRLRLKDALVLFEGFEMQSKGIIEALIKEYA